MCVYANVVVSSPKRKKTAAQEMIDAVSRLVDVHEAMLEVKKAKLELKREEVILKKAELVSKGWFQDEVGNWVRLMKEGEE